MSPKTAHRHSPQEDHMDCDSCALWRNMGPTMVPDGNRWVSAGDSWECSQGHDPGDCPAEAHHAVSYDRRDEEYYDRGDYEREKWL